MSTSFKETVGEKEWHGLTAEESLATLQANPGGLTSDDAATRLSQ